MNKPNSDIQRQMQNVKEAFKKKKGVSFLRKKSKNNFDYIFLESPKNQLISKS